MLIFQSKRAGQRRWDKNLRMTFENSKPLTSFEADLQRNVPFGLNNNPEVILTLKFISFFYLFSVSYPCLNKMIILNWVTFSWPDLTKSSVRVWPFEPVEIPYSDVILSFYLFSFLHHMWVIQTVTDATMCSVGQTINCKGLMLDFWSWGKNFRSYEW